MSGTMPDALVGDHDAALGGISSRSRSLKLKT
jgi:hypothetical protein